MKSKQPQYFFWLGEDGEVEMCDKDTFDKRQRDWKGPRPNDEQDVGG